MPQSLLTIAVALLVVYAVLVLALALSGRHARELLRFVPDCAVLFARLARDPRSSRAVRWTTLATAGYLAFPIDLVPDFIPIAGQLDDVVVVALALRFVINRAGAEAVRRNWPGTDSGLRALLRFAANARER